MAADIRSRLILWLPTAVCIGIIAAIGQLWPMEPSARSDAAPRYTIDRGGYVRWVDGKPDVQSVFRFNNGKTDVETAFPFSLVDGSSRIPPVIGIWHGAETPSTADPYLADPSIVPEVLVSRDYRSAEGDVFFTAVGSSLERKLHPPEICYNAVEWKMMPLPLRRIAVRDGEVELPQFLGTSPSGESRLVTYAYIWQDGRRRSEDGLFIVTIGTSLGPHEELDQAGARVDHFVQQVVLTARPADTLSAFLRQ